MPNRDRILKLTVITTDREPISVECDSIHLTVKDNEKGHGGGCYGIRYGHENAVIALGKGPLEAFEDGKSILKLDCSEGFARVEREKITAVIEKIG